MNNRDWKRIGIDVSVDIIGGILIALGTYNFAATADFPMVGLNGIALIFWHLFKTPIGTVAMILNIPIAIGCYKILGRDFFIRSIRTIIITSLIMDYVAPLFPVYEGDKLLAAVCTGVLSGLGFAFIYMRNSSTGGVDFIMLSIKAKKPHISLGKITFIIDFIVVLIGVVVVTRDIDSLIYGVIITYLLSVVVDKVMYGVDAGKLTMIITEYPREVAEKIDELVGRGATFIKAEGSYKEDEKKIVMCACNNKQMFIIKTAVKEIDPNAFVVIMESNEVLGEGFKAH